MNGLLSDSNEAALLQRIKQVAGDVPDPEMPFLSVADLGILRGIELRDRELIISVSPTYSGCPAVAVIEQNIQAAVIESLQALAQSAQIAQSVENADLVENDASELRGEGIDRTLSTFASTATVSVRRELSPAWTTNDLTAQAQRKLLANGIAPPVDSIAASTTHATAAINFFSEPVVDCPRCQSSDTSRLARFGSTPCKAQYRCNDCLEPFDHFKCLR